MLRPKDPALVTQISGNSNERWRRCEKLFAADGKLVSTYTFCSWRSSIHLFLSFLRALEKLRTETISFSMSVCLSVRSFVRMEVGCQWTESHEIWYLRIFRKSVQKIQVPFKSTRKTGTIHEGVCPFMISRWINKLRIM